METRGTGVLRAPTGHPSPVTGCAFAAYLTGSMTVMTAAVASGATTAAEVRLSWTAILPAVAVLHTLIEHHNTNT